MPVKDEHEIYCCGARVKVSARGVEIISEPLGEYCPLHKTRMGLSPLMLKLYAKMCR